jgi:hypothetical protein
MTQRRRRQEGARRAQESAAQRVQQRRQAQRRRLYISAGVLAVLIAAIVASQLVSFGPDLGQKVQALAGTHNPPYTYNTRPPTSGNHLTSTAPYGFNSRPLQPSNVVHNMEHGAVVIWFQPGDDVLAGQVRDLVLAVGDECLVAGPYADMDDTVAVSGWGRILRLDAFDSAQIREFIAAYRGDLGPEAGICRRES